MMGQYQGFHDDGGADPRGREARRGLTPAATDREVARRSYVDRDGLAWEVREVPGAEVPGARGGRCLVFESPVVIRRVWEVPPNWCALTAAELSELSWRR